MLWRSTTVKTQLVTLTRLWTMANARKKSRKPPSSRSILHTPESLPEATNQHGLAAREFLAHCPSRQAKQAGCTEMLEPMFLLNMPCTDPSVQLACSKGRDSHGLHGGCAEDEQATS